MSVAIKLSKCLLARIEQVKSDSAGFLYGLTENKATLVLGFSCSLATKAIEKNLPIGFKALGTIRCGENLVGPNNSIEVAILHVNYDFKSGQPLSVWVKNKSNEWESVAHEVIAEEELWKDWVCVRSQFTLKFAFDQNIQHEAYRSELINRLAEAKAKFLETQKPTLKIADTEIVLKAGKVMTGIGKNGKVSAALLQTKKGEASETANGFSTLNIQVLSDENSTSDELSSAFTNFSLNESGSVTSIEFHALALVKSTLGASNLYEIVLKSIERNFTIVEQNVHSVKRSLKTFVFYPKEIGHLISFVYPTKKEDDDNDQILQRQCAYIIQNLLRPCFRRADEYDFRNHADDTYLVNPHIGLKSLVKDGKQYIVKGSYTYHHYMQDNFNDDGWGCAYRSFQTLFSWYRHQGYTSKRVPTHAEIQQCLIDLGDKPKTFLNSRQWIGSTEVSMCLQHFLDVDSRIIHVNSGADMAQHGPTFAQHFTTYGTPVMIGGGVLAHTILGVDYNSQTNELKFLVLDPHYTGADELDIVQKKGWCAWKSTTFWDKKSYYNFCMPMFPDSVEY